MITSRSRIKKRIVVFVLLASLAAFAACSGDDESVAPDKNSAPVIVFTVSALAVSKDADATLSVTATDPDGDDVSVLWEVTRDGHPSGTLNSSQQGSSTITWVTPATTGRDTITITATDGNGGTAVLVETILVGTPKTPDVVSPNVTWKTSDSPFIIRPADQKFTIDGAASLIVEAGCQLLIDKTDLEFDVVGSMRTNGTAQAPVIIRPNVRAPEPGFWVGFEVSPSFSSPFLDLRHTDILYATNGIYAVGDAEVRLDGCRVMFSSANAVLFQSGMDLHVLNSAITNNAGSGIRIGGPAVTTQPDSVVISGDSLAVNGDLSGSTPYTDQAAIYIDIPDYYRDSVIQILGSEISLNGFPGIQLVRASFPEVHGNRIFSNELGKATQRYNIRLDNGFGVGGVQTTLDARYNYWGAPFTNPATDSLLIQQMIRDSGDNGTIAVRVLIYPWSGTP